MREFTTCLHSFYLYPPTISIPHTTSDILQQINITWIQSLYMDRNAFMYSWAHSPFSLWLTHIACPAVMDTHSAGWAVLTGWEMGKTPSCQRGGASDIHGYAYLCVSTRADESEWTLSPASGALLLPGSSCASTKDVSAKCQAFYTVLIF